MAQFDCWDVEERDRSAWVDAAAETSPELMPEKLPPEFSPTTFSTPVQRQRRRVELPKITRSS